MKIIAIVVSLALSAATAAEQLGTSFTYQGTLQYQGQPASGTYDLQFDLFDAETGGFDVEAPVLLEGVQVENGVFTVELDYGPAAFVGDQLWIEVAIRDGSSTGEYTTLLPRQKLTAQPYALHAEMVAMGAVGIDEIDPLEVQARIGTGCTTGSLIRAIDGDGTVTCENDQDTTYAAGEGIVLSGNEFSIDNDTVQLRVLGSCAAGSTISSINANGSVSCKPDQDTQYTAGTGLVLDSNVLSIDDSYIQRPLAGYCVPGFSLRRVEANGAVTCQPVTTDASDLTSGTLNTSRYDAYDDLSVSGRLNNDADEDLLTRSQADDRYLSGTLSISGRLIFPVDGCTFEIINGGGYFETGSNCSARIPLQLPNDVKLNELKCAVYDESPVASEYINIRLFRTRVLSEDAFFDPIFTPPDSSGPTPFQVLSDNEPVSGREIVDNDVFAYELRFLFGTGPAAGSGVRVKGCTLTYSS